MAQPPEILTNLDNKDNYRRWKSQMLEYLEAKGLIEGLHGFGPHSGLSATQKSVTRDLAYIIIKESLGDEVARRVARLKTATALWKKLYTLCEKPLVVPKGRDARDVAASKAKELEIRILELQDKLNTRNLDRERLSKELEQLTSQIAERKMDSNS